MMCNPQKSLTTLWLMTKYEEMVMKSIGGFVGETGWY